MTTFTITEFNPENDIDNQSLVINHKVNDFTHFSNGEVDIHFKNGDTKTIQLGSKKAIKVEIQ